MTRTSIFLAALAATGATLSFPAYAADAVTSTEVHYSDLNLASSAGAKALKDRVVRAAKRVCAADGQKDLEGVQEARTCAKQAFDRAMPQVELALANAGTRRADNSRLSVSAH